MDVETNSPVVLLTRREIMRILPEIKHRVHFNNLIRRLHIEKAGERRDRHVIVYLYDPMVVTMIRTELAAGDPRKRGWD